MFDVGAKKKEEDLMVEALTSLEAMVDVGGAYGGGKKGAAAAEEDMDTLSFIDEVIQTARRSGSARGNASGVEGGSREVAGDTALPSAGVAAEGRGGEGGGAAEEGVTLVSLVQQVTSDE